MDRTFEEFYDAALEATRKGKGLKMNRYGTNLRYNSEGVYSYNTKTADLDWNLRKISKRGTWSKTSSKHYNYAKSMLETCYDFAEVSPAPPGAPREWLHQHVQNMSYDDHT